MTVISYLAAAAAAALAAFAVEAAAKHGDERVSVYQCDRSVRLPEGGYAELSLTKLFREDGSVYSMNVHWEDDQGSLVRLQRPGDQAFLSLKWPGEHRIDAEHEPFDWSRGSATILYLAADGAIFRNLKGEEWRRTVVARDDSVRTVDDGGMKLLVLMGYLHLVSDLEPTSSRGRLTMPIDLLLAWGSGVERLTVYETRVTRRKARPNTYPTSPAGRHRVVGSYEVDIAASSVPPGWSARRLKSGRPTWRQAGGNASGRVRGERSS